MARMTLSYGVAQIVAPALAGYIATVTGSYRGALWLAAAVMLAGMAALAALREKPAHRPLTRPTSPQYITTHSADLSFSLRALYKCS